MHSGNGVTGVDRALKGIGRVYLRDLADLRDIQLGRDARRHVFTGRCGREQNVAVMGSDGQHLRGQVFGQAVGQAVAVGMDHFAHAHNLSGGGGGSSSVVAGHQHMHLTATGQRCGHGVQSSAFDRGVVVFCNNQCTHDQITFATFFNLSTSVATSATLMPALRLAGSDTLSVLMRGVTSTPKSSGLKMSSCFFLAFMMLGKVT